MKSTKVPIYCSRCRILALANLAGTPLCPLCLMAAVKASSDPHIIGKIKPLSIASHDIQGIVKCRKQHVAADPPVKPKIWNSSSFSY